MKKQDLGERPPRRRDFLGLAIVTTALAGASVAHAEAARCEAADTDPGRSSMRKALEYISPSNLPSKACSGCAFYATTAPNCGKCQLLNGPVSGDAVCSSWAPKK